MGLEKGDLDKVSKSITLEQCYERIYDWHKKNYRNILNNENYPRSSEDKYVKDYFEYLRLLPEPKSATKEDMKKLFSNVVSNLMEWSYHEKDGHRIKIAAYAHFALSKFF